MANEARPTDDRPPVWIGHVHMHTDRLEASHQFLLAAGLRPIARGEAFAVLELRGGTHLVLSWRASVAPGPAPFDLMVDDIEIAHRHMDEAGLAPSAILDGHIHRSFTVTDPSGQVLIVNSSHVSDLPV